MLYTHRLFECKVCGYKYREELEVLPEVWHGSSWEIVEGDEEFIRIEVKGHYFLIGHEEEVFLYACPKCKTVKMGE